MNRARKVLQMLEQDGYENRVDQWLSKKGWKETGGIALYTHKKYPLVGVDTNSGAAEVIAYTSPSEIFNAEGSMIEYSDNLKDIEKAIELAGFLTDLYTQFTKKFKGTFDGFHFTSHSISAFSKSKKAPWTEIYFDQPGKIVIVIGQPLNKRVDLPSMKPNAQLAKKVFQWIGDALK